MHRIAAGTAASLALLTACGAAAGGSPESGLPPGLDWKHGPCAGELGDQAAVQVPAGYVFLEKKDMPKFLEMTENLASGKELGVLLPESLSWAVYFDYSDSGYVKDDDKDKLDADALMKSIQEGQEAANTVRSEKGWAPMHVVGWEAKPFFDNETKNLVWAIRFKTDKSESVNYNSRILGREGVMEANLVVSPGELAATVPTYKEILAGYGYNQGRRYAEFRSGDKVAKYGLAALITGGAIAAAAKTGLLAKLAKFGKLLIVGGLALLALAGKFLRRLFTRSGEGETLGQGPAGRT